MYITGILGEQTHDHVTRICVSCKVRVAKKR